MRRDPDELFVCLDLGGVVIRHCRSWEEGCAAAGLKNRDPDRMAQMELMMERRTLNDAHQRGEISPEQFWQGVSESTGGLYTPEEVEHLHLSWILEEYEFVPELVRELASTPGVRTGCLSNTNEAHWTRATRYDGGPLTNCAAVKHMEILLASHEMGCVKPDEAIYEKAERISGYPGERIVFFDDLDRNIDAAKARGWRAHKIDHEGCPATQMRKVLTGMEIL